MDSNIFYFTVSYYIDAGEGRTGFGQSSYTCKNPYPNRVELTESIKKRDNQIKDIVIFNIQKLTEKEYKLFTSK